MFIKVNVRGGSTQLVNLFHIERVRPLTPLPSAKDNDPKSCMHMSSGKPEFIEILESVAEVEKLMEAALDIQLK